ncbi:unnamed protein product [Brassicogethes aeneus]|uniref:Lipase n=1 Tax=Brassicogethes aeneus TaxID=1431903 RepID=A0A9P0FN43_BRAAE|nr:unnamed protein product [Brassicogethes aeneus]
MISKFVLFLLPCFMMARGETEAFEKDLLLYSADTERECEFFEDIMPHKKRNGSCELNPDVYLNVPQIIARHGYPSEAHIVQTKDGYLLTLHRIPGPKSGKRGGQPVFLQHGLLGSSADWVVNEGQALAFFLADQGYDVWLGNARGNTYSKAHVTYSIKSPAYWNFSWHEMGTYDLPAVLQYVSTHTNRPGEIIYIGHSMGTTMFFVFSSLKPQAAKNVKLMIALAPTAYMTHVRSPIRYLAPFSNDAQWILRNLGFNQFLPRGKILDLLNYECQLLEQRKICENAFFLICGFNKAEMNMDILPVAFAHDPAGSSTKTVLHYGQEIHANGNFQQYDYGKEINMIKYNQSTPLKYDVGKIRSNIYLMYAEKDKLTSPIDVLRLSHKLPNLIGLYRVPNENFDHVDFIFGKDAMELVNKQVLKVIHNFTETDMV